MKCPVCKSICYRDEHPDGYAVGRWGCSSCHWSEETQIAEDMNYELLEEAIF